MIMIKIVDSHEIPFVYKRKHLIAFINEGKTVWEVFIRYKRDFLTEGWTEKKKDFNTPQEVLGYVFEKVKHKLDKNKVVE